MPAVSKSQQRAAGMALAAKRGDMKVSELQGAAKDMYDSMSEKELEKFAKTKTKDLPDKKESVNEAKLKESEISYRKLAESLLDEVNITESNAEIKEATKNLKHALQSGNRLSVNELENDEISIGTGHRYGVKVKILGFNK